MAYFIDMLERANLQGVREYLMFGEQTERCLDGYEERLSRVYTDCLNVVKQYDCEGEESDLFKSAVNMATEHESVYMEMGIRAGFLLATDVGSEGQKDKENDSLYSEMYVKLFKGISKIIAELQEEQRSVEEMYISNS